MGTRGYQKVITKDGEVKIRQYNQWDSYPSGQGVDILTYLRGGDLVKYQENVKDIPQVTDEEIEKVNESDNWRQEYPYLSRDCGANIHQMIENGEVPYVSHCSEEEAREWCEGFYTIDFNQNIFITEYYDDTIVFRLDKLPTVEEYLEKFQSED